MCNPGDKTNKYLISELIECFVIMGEAPPRPYVVNGKKEGKQY